MNQAAFPDTPPLPRHLRWPVVAPRQWALLWLLGAVALGAWGCGGDETTGLGPSSQDCSGCHGSDDNPAPPRGVDGELAISAVEVGAHQAHLHDSEVRLAMWCQECHRVPTTLDEPTHRDAPPAELTFGVLSRSDGAEPSWDHETATCSDVYCHGATLTGGANNTPIWNAEQGTQAFCGACHGIPPMAPHPPSYECGKCHPDTINDSGGIDIAAGKHINGQIDVIALDCNSCHGNDQNDAPPLSTTGEQDTTAVTVGAHQSHLVDGKLRRAVDCADCHVVPQSVSEPTHMDAPPAELIFGLLATTDGATPAWDRTAATCTGSYCHGATLSGGTNTTPRWTDVGGDQAACGSCHGLPPPPPHPDDANCVDCHAATVDANFTINIDNHINGILDVDISGACDKCHGGPPATGAHLLHFGTTPAEASYGGTGVTGDIQPVTNVYAMDCGNCHPTDPSHHINGVPNHAGATAEIDLSPTSAPPGTVKAMHPGSVWYEPGTTLLTDATGMTYTEGTCTDVYCHSKRVVTTPSPVPAPGVDFTFNGYPIVYPPYAVDISREYASVPWNGSLGCDGCHGLPPRTSDPNVFAGAGDSHSWIDDQGYENLHGWNHGGDPMPCSACHYATVIDPGARTRTSVPPADQWSVYDPVAIADKRFHINGQPDVAFSPDPVTVTSTGFDLTSSVYDPTTESCSAVPCHKQQTTVVWGTPHRWNNGNECNRCHQF